MKRENAVEQLKDKIDGMDEKELKETLKALDKKPKRKSLVYRIMDSIDNFLDKSSRIYVYTLEIIGIAIVIYLLSEFIVGIRLIYKGELDRGQAIVEAVRIAVASVKEILIGIFIAVPTAIGTLRSLNKKWSGNGNGNGNGSPPITDVATVEGMSEAGENFSPTPTID